MVVEGEKWTKTVLVASNDELSHAGRASPRDDNPLVSLVGGLDYIPTPWALARTLLTGCWTNWAWRDAGSRDSFVGARCYCAKSLKALLTRGSCGRRS